MRFPLLRFLFRKMWNNRWLTLSSLGGLIVAVAFITSIPMYSDGSLKRVVSKSLQEMDDGLPAGSLMIRYQTIGSDKPDLASIQSVNEYIEQEIPARIDFPVFNYVQNMAIRFARVTPVDPEKVDASKRRQMSMVSLSELEDHVQINNGRMFSHEIEDGVIEAVVLDDTMYRNYFQVGDEFYYPISGVSGLAPLKVKVVGSIQPNSPTSPHDAYWFQGLDGYMNAFMVSDQLFKRELLETMNIPLDVSVWYYNFDLRDIQTSELSPLSRELDRMDVDLYQHLKNTRIDFSFKDMLRNFRSISVQLQTLLFTLAAPMIAMVFYYIVMNARQALEKQRSDISVMQSRGGSTKQIIRVYALENIILGITALIIGPAIGWFMAKSIGSSNGFLKFVNRESIPVDVSPSIIVYGLIAVLVALTASLIPAISYARQSIVSLKQQMARSDRRPFWQRWYLDIVLIGLSAYGWYVFNDIQALSMRSGLTSDQIQVQPLLFFVPALAIFSIGLFFLRAFPRILQFMGWLAKAFLPISFYLTLTQLSRSAKAYYPLMLLLILTLGLGVYNSSSARTIDLNSTERTLYKHGTDVVIQPAWEAYVETQTQAPPTQPENPGEGNDGGSGGGGGNPGNPGGGGGSGAPNPPPTLHYQEPPFQIFQQLEGVEHATRVLQTKGNAIVSGRSAGQGTVFGIDNVDFAEVGWFRDNDLLRIHQNHYLDLLGHYEQAVIIPKDFADRHQLKPGDLMTITINQEPIEFIVVASLPFWPSLYPKEQPFFIMNLDYVYDQIPLMPYEVWIKMTEGALLTPLMEELANHNIQIASIDDVRIELAQEQKQPSRGGVFGILSLGFLVSVLISLTGYLLYWFFNLSSRVVQFGILRAMGLSRKQLTGMLLLEQLFTAGLSITIGILTGKLASYLFLPFLQTSDDAKTQIPPFQVVFNSSDTAQIYIVVACMMLMGAGLLFIHIRKLRIHQAVKLGEER